MKIKPREGLIIRDPNSFEPLLAEGEDKPQTAYWLNHLKNGDVIVVEETAETSAKNNRTRAASKED